MGRVAGVNWCASQQAGRQVVHIWRQRIEEVHQCHANMCLVHCRHVPNCGNKLIIFLCCAAGANVSEPIFVPGHTSLVLWLSAFGQQERSFFSGKRREECLDPGISCLQQGGVIAKNLSIFTRLPPPCHNSLALQPLPFGRRQRSFKPVVIASSSCF